MLRALIETRKRARSDVDLEEENKIPAKKKKITPKLPVAMTERLFYHMQSMETFFVDANDSGTNDSESDFEYDWSLYRKKISANQCLDDDEKMMMILWNGFIESNQILWRGWKNVDAVCKRFIEMHSNDILDHKLYRNFILHLCRLSKIGLLSAKNVAKLINHIHAAMYLETDINNKTGNNQPERHKPRSCEYVRVSVSLAATKSHEFGHFALKSRRNSYANDVLRK